MQFGRLLPVSVLLLSAACGSSPQGAAPMPESTLGWAQASDPEPQSAPVGSKALSGLGQNDPSPHRGPALPRERLALATTIPQDRVEASANDGGAGPTTSPDAANTATASPPSLHVSAGTILDGTGTPVVLHGVNRSGSEFACVGGFGFFDGPTDAASIVAMKAWNINAVRVPLNEDCWLGISVCLPRKSCPAPAR